MDDLSMLQKKVRSYFKARQPNVTQHQADKPMVPAKVTSPNNSGHSPRDSISARLENIKLSAPKIISGSTGSEKVRPAGPRPHIPKSLTVEPHRVLEYLRDFPALGILFLDVRSREEFEHARIRHESVVNIDPLICRESLDSQALEDALEVSPVEEAALFRRRHEFDLLILYDRNSRTLLPSESPDQQIRPEALQNLEKALFERVDWRKPLLRAPMLMVGGLEAWGAAGGPILDLTDTGHATAVSTGLGNPVVVQQLIYDAAVNGNNKKTNRVTAIVPTASPPYPRSVREYIFDTSRQQSMVAVNGTATMPIDSNQQRHSLQRSPRPASTSSPTREHGPYLERRQLPGKPHRLGAAPVYTRQPSVGAQSSRLGLTTIGKTGLKNLGNSCFMNAVLQCLAACFPLARYFTSGQWKNDVCVSNPLGYRGNIAKEFAKVLRDLSSDDNSVIAPVDLRHELGRTRPEFASNEQQDAQELLNFLLDAIHEDLNANALKSQLRELNEAEEFHRETLADPFVSEIEWKRHTHRNSSIIVKLFQGQLQSRLKCLTCGHSSTTYNAFSSLSLPIPPKKGAISVEDCVREFVKAEGMTGEDSWYCARCKAKRNAYKKLSISRLPDVLIIHFKRFESKGPWRDKLNTPIDFPLTGLDMTQFLGQGLQNSTSVKSIYDVFGIVYHRGSMEGGHYTAMVNADSQRAEDWTLFDDSRVAPNNEIDRKASYLLFYSKRPTMM